MKKALIFLLPIIVVALGIWYVRSDRFSSQDLPEISDLTKNRDTSTTQTQDKSSSEDVPAVTVIAKNLDTPWGIAFLPNGSMLVTERKGTVRFVDATGVLQPNPVITVTNVREIGEGGLLGIVLHPDFAVNNYIYLYYTYKSSGGSTLNRVVCMTYKDNKLSDEKSIVDAIPGDSNHNGGRIKFGPDRLLYIGTGDAEVPSRAQDTNSLAGKILRVTDEGRPANGNPFDFAQGKPLGDPRVFSYGHRNVQGLTWDQNGTFWATEHGRSGILSGLDEVNLIQSGRNYGWPEIQGDEVRSGMETPVRHSGATTTWAPSGAAYLGGSLFFGGLRGQALYEAVLSGNRVSEVKEHFKGQFGRLRDVVAGPDSMLYITTSNRDGRGKPTSDDDRIIRVNPDKL